MRTTQLLIFSLLATLTLPAFSDIKAEIHQLSREKYKLTRQISKLFNEKKLDENPEYEATQKTAYEASRTYSKAQRSHLKLKELYTKSDAAQKKWIDARLAKDDAAVKTARSAYTQARMDIQKAARDIPELVELQNKAIEANKASQAKQKELLATTDEGKELIKKIDALDAKMAELRKKMQAAK